MPSKHSAVLIILILICQVFRLTTSVVTFTTVQSETQYSFAKAFFFCFKVFVCFQSTHAHALPFARNKSDCFPEI
jgi:hypothetical protein